MLYSESMTPGAFVPDRETPFSLLARHRQPLAANVARSYIEALTGPGDLVVDPFAASPVVGRVAFQSGRRAIAVDSNPLTAFVVRLQATLPAPREIQVVLARWGEIPREGGPLDAHIEEQYGTLCASCGQAVIADYFLWGRDVNLPVEKAYQCPRCGPRRDPATEMDRARAAEYKARGFQYHLILERLAASESPYYNLLRERLGYYTPRNLYALVTLTLKLDSAARDENGRQVLLGLLLHALDVGSSIYPSIDGLPERKIPETYVEVNIWRALRQAAAGLAEIAPGVAAAASPEAVANSAAPALFVGQGSSRALAQSLQVPVRLILTSPSRLDPLYWELAYLWTRWLLGKNASRSLEPFLEEERQRWGWYGNALVSALRDAAQLLAAGGHFIAAFPSGSHAMIQALTTAASPVLHLETFAFRPHRGALSTTEFGALRGDYRVVWSPGETAIPSQSAYEVSREIRTHTLEGANAVLAARGEPLSYSWVHHGALVALARSGALAGVLNVPMHPRDNPFQFLHRELDAGLKEGYAHDFDHLQEAGRVLWVRRREGSAPLADRVEAAVREVLHQAKLIGEIELEDAVLARFPELLTPELELVEACAAAYADKAAGEWRWREANPEEDDHILELVGELGSRLRFEVVKGSGPGILIWRDEKVIPGSSRGTVAEERVREDSHRIITGANVDLHALLQTRIAPLRGLVVLREQQTALVREKLRRSPNTRAALREAGWEFLRIDLIERLGLLPTVTRAEFQLALGLDSTFGQGKEQLGLF